MILRMVGVAGFEPAASWTRTKRDTKLRHTPIDPNIIMRNHLFVKGCWYFWDRHTHRFVRGDGMGYKIVYGDGPKSVYDKNVTGNRLRILTAACFLAFCLLVRLVWPEGVAVLRDVMLPGEETVTELAFESMLDNLRSGEPVGDALTVFCREVIQNGSDLAK